jgi:hypothetical protein
MHTHSEIRDLEELRTMLPPCLSLCRVVGVLCKRRAQPGRHRRDTQSAAFMDPKPKRWAYAYLLVPVSAERQSAPDAPVTATRS